MIETTLPVANTLVAQEPQAVHRIRDDGWTPDAQRGFIEALVETGSVRSAAKAVGLSASTAYRLRAAPHGGAFRAAWDAAIAMAYTRLREVAFERAINGVEQPVFQDGEEVGTRTLYSDRLLMFLLTHTENRVPQYPLREFSADQPGRRVPDAFAAAMVALDSPPPPHGRAKPRDQR